MATIEQIRAPAQYGITAVRGDSLELVFRLVSAETGAPISLAGWGGFAAVYPAPGSAQVLLELGVDVSQDAAGLAGTGLVTMTATGEDTAMLVSGVWKLVLTDDPASKTVVAGQWCMVEPFAGGIYVSDACVTVGACSVGGQPGCSTPGSCGYSETLGHAIPCGSSCASGPTAPATSEITVTVGTVCSC